MPSVPFDDWDRVIRLFGGAMAVLGALAAIVGALYLWLVGGRLAEQILEDGLDVRYSMQMHKLLWGEKPGV